ncbi:hypothetical protein ACQP1P_26635 [Dactylosporangium sp. CA-052675]|uniref:hypothetical protein n=1 Tax=Dactylosporangium sp. CA-052675 TaxID=3239927 RepID=UPI003D934EFE
MRGHRALLALAGLTALAGCGTTAKPVAPSPPSPSAAGAAPSAPSSQPGPAAPQPSATGPDAPILLGTRRVVIRPAEAGESILAVDGSGRLNVTDGGTGKGLFVLVPTGARHMIRSATGDRACLGLRSNGSAPLTIAATACDPSRDGQLFTIKPPESGDPATFTISVGDAFLLVSGANGLIAEELGDATPLTTFVFVDNGPAS